MVIAEIEDPRTKKVYQIYFDGKLKKELDKIKIRITKKDYDYVLIIDGEEGSGKSVIAMQICKYIDPTFDNDRIYFNGRDCHEGITQSIPKTAHQFDEAFTGLSSRTALSEINHLLNSMIMQMRQKNLFVCIVLPSIFILDKYPAMFRSRALIHVYFKNGRRGNYVVFNRKKKNLLILKGRKDYGYHYVKSRFHGRFTDKYVVDETTYRVNKLKALQDKPKNVKHEVPIGQRNALIDELAIIHKYSGIKISNLLKDKGYELHASVVNKILAESRLRPENHANAEDIL